jgi:outer membrane protein assembly factor BamA
MKLTLLSFRPVLCGMIASLSVVGFSSPAAAQQPNQVLNIAKIDFLGLRKITPDQAIEASGLRTGEKVNADDLDAAGQKLMDSGLFSKVNYRVRSVGTSASVFVVFEVEELASAVPVVFDNFVWFSEDELFNAVKAEVPSFNGMLPESGKTTDGVLKALQELLRAAKIQGQVEYSPYAGESGGNSKHVFTVTGVKVPVCSVQFKGTRSVSETTLVEKSAPLLSDEYSQEVARTFAVAGLQPVYQQLGYLRASIAFDSARLEQNDKCKDGVAITYLVDEGNIYTWSGTEWNGNTSYSAAELNAAFEMKEGDIADGVKIETGFLHVKELFGRRGFVALRMKRSPLFDDRARRVTYKVSLSEGPQYKMGTLIITGLADADAAKLKNGFNLQGGEIFNASYVEQFKSGFVPRSGIVKPPTKEVDLRMRRDASKLVVDVEIFLQ